MNIEVFRKYCLSLGNVSEKMPFGKFAARYDSILAFYVCGHMFCFIDIDNFTFVNVKSTPDEIEDIKERHVSIGTPINQSLKHCLICGLALKKVVRAMGILLSFISFFG